MAKTQSGGLVEEYAKGIEEYAKGIEEHAKEIKGCAEKVRVPKVDIDKYGWEAKDYGWWDGRLGKPTQKYDGVMKKKLAQKTGIWLTLGLEPVKYDGAWTDGQAKGSGVFFEANKEVYEGEFDGGKPNGGGKLIKDGKAIYDGNFENGLPNGRGELIKDGKTVYDGNFENGLPNGRGKLIKDRKTVYDGNFKNGLPDGRGELIKDEKTLYDGNFKDGKLKANPTIRDGSGTTKAQPRTTQAVHSPQERQSTHPNRSSASNATQSTQVPVAQTHRRPPPPPPPRHHRAPVQQKRVAITTFVDQNDGEMPFVDREIINTAGDGIPRILNVLIRRFVVG
jgi:hypothetical protein